MDSKLNQTTRNLETSVDGQFSLKISRDHLSVYLDISSLSAGDGKPVDLQTVLARLKHSGIIEGINKEAIETTLASASSGKPPEKPVLIVQAHRPVSSEEAQLNWVINPESDQRARAVLPEQLLLTLKPAIPGTPGRDVFGNPINVSPVKDFVLVAGNGIKRKTEEGVIKYYAETFGLVEYKNNELSISLPLVVSDDGMAANANIILPRVYEKGSVTKTHVMDALKAQGIIYGINEEIISQAISAAEGADDGCVKNVVVASGTEKRDGVKARLELAHELSPAVKLSGGRLDLHELDYPWEVKKGTILGKFIQSKMALDGITVTGIKDKAREVREIQPELANISMDETGTLISEMDGSFIIDGFRLEVTDLVVIKGNVDLHTGNIHTDSSVLVKGHVSPGFIVEAKGEVIVDQNVEDAVVKSDSRVTIRGGVRGHSKIYSGGHFSCAFVEYGEIVAEDSIEILKNAVDSKLTAGKNITIGNGLGIIIASKCIASGQVWVGKIGHPSSEVCEFRLGMPEDKINRLHHLHSQKNLTSTEKNECERLEKMYRRSDHPAMRVSGKIESDVILHIGHHALRIQNTPCAHDYYIDPEKNELTYRLYNKKSPIPGRKKHHTPAKPAGPSGLRKE